MYSIYDEFVVGGRLIAGPFATLDEAAAALGDPAFPFEFIYGPSTVVGEAWVEEAA